MKPVGFLLLVAGWGLVLAAIGMLTKDAPRTAFVLAGVAVELLGLILVGRAHLLAREEKS
jgi:cytochrome c biogenesis protein CcdA